MPTVTTPIFCPYCHIEINPIDLKTGEATLSEVPHACPSCGRTLKIAPNKHFDSPDYVYHQRNSLLEELQVGKPKLGEKEVDERTKEITSELLRWFRNCPADDRIAALDDALSMMEHLLFTSIPGEDLRRVVALAKKIGALGNIVEQYFKSGGSPYDRDTRPVWPDARDADGHQAAATARRNN